MAATIIGFAVIYRWRLRDGSEEAFRAAWAAVTDVFIRERGGLGSGLEHLEGTAFHSFRRHWASCRKGLSYRDIMEAGGWSSLAALQSSYMRPDGERMLKVVLHEGELREVR